MRLKLVSRTPEPDVADKGWRRLDEGELTLGRSPACGWVLKGHGDAVALVHCRIARRAASFVVRAESADGITVDGEYVADGETARLADGSRVAFAGLAFVAEIEAEEPDWSDPDAPGGFGDDVPSITTILADIAPGGRTATGVLPGRRGETWLEDAAVVGGDATGAAPLAAAAGAAEPRAVLPADWHLDTAASQNEHVAATGVRVRVPQRRSEPAEPPEVAVVSGHDQDLVDAFLVGAGWPATTAADVDPAGFLRGMGEAVGAALRGLDGLERLADEAYEDAGLAPPPRPPKRDPAAFAPRLERLAADHRALREAAAEAIDEATRRLDPRLVEAEADTPRDAADRFLAPLRRLPLVAERRCWRTYRAAYGRGGSLRDRYRAALRRRLEALTEPAFVEVPGEAGDGGRR